eukprot:9148050-Prorocentrum_lima.AAC.1
MVAQPGADVGIEDRDDDGGLAQAFRTIRRGHADASRKRAVDGPPPKGGEKKKEREDAFLLH